MPMTIDEDMSEVEVDEERVATRAARRRGTRRRQRRPTCPGSAILEDSRSAPATGTPHPVDSSSTDAPRTRCPRRTRPAEPRLRMPARLGVCGWVTCPRPSVVWSMRRGTVRRRLKEHRGRAPNLRGADPARQVRRPRRARQAPRHSGRQAGPVGPPDRRRSAGIVPAWRPSRSCAPPDADGPADRLLHVVVPARPGRRTPCTPCVPDADRHRPDLARAHRCGRPRRLGFDPGRATPARRRCARHLQRCGRAPVPLVMVEAASGSPACAASGSDWRAPRWHRSVASSAATSHSPNVPVSANAASPKRRPSSRTSTGSTARSAARPRDSARSETMSRTTAAGIRRGLTPPSGDLQPEREAASGDPADQRVESGGQVGREGHDGAGTATT